MDMKEYGKQSERTCSSRGASPTSLLSQIGLLRINKTHNIPAYMTTKKKKKKKKNRNLNQKGGGPRRVQARAAPYGWMPGKIEAFDQDKKNTW